MRLSRYLPSRFRAVGVFAVIFSCAVVAAACSNTPENSVDADAMSAIRRLSVVSSSPEAHVVLLEASSEGEAESFGADWISQFVEWDTAAVSERIGAIQGLTAVKPVNEADKAMLTSAPSGRTSSQAPNVNVASIMEKAGTDALLWARREYRLRLTRSTRGEQDQEWTGEVKSILTVYDRTGKSILSATWVDHSSKVERGASLSGQAAVPLLIEAAENAVETTTRIVTAAKTESRLPADLGRERTGLEQARINVLAEGAVCLRGLVVLALVLGGLYLFGQSWVSDSKPGLAVRALGMIGTLAIVGLAGYLIFGLHWWRDAVQTVLNILSEGD